MNRFRRPKRDSGSNHNNNGNNSSSSGHPTAVLDQLNQIAGEGNAAGTSTNLDESMQAMDALVDSDPESTEIFDDHEREGSGDRYPPSSPTSNASAAADAVRHLTSPLFGGGGGQARNGGRSFHGRDGPSGRANGRGDDDDEPSAEDSSRGTQDDSLSHDDDDDDDDDDHKSDHSSGEDYSDDEDEGEEGYRPGGYHRVSIGEVYNQRWVVVTVFAFACVYVCVCVCCCGWK